MTQVKKFIRLAIGIFVLLHILTFLFHEFLFFPETIMGIYTYFGLIILSSVLLYIHNKEKDDESN